MNTVGQIPWLKPSLLPTPRDVPAMTATKQMSEMAMSAMSMMASIRSNLLMFETGSDGAGFLLTLSRIRTAGMPVGLGCR